MQRMETQGSSSRWNPSGRRDVYWFLSVVFCFSAKSFFQIVCNRAGEIRSPAHCGLSGIYSRVPGPWSPGMHVGKNTSVVGLDEYLPGQAEGTVGSSF